MIEDYSAPFAVKLQEHLLAEREQLVDRIVKGVEREEYLRAVGRISQVDLTLAQMEELYLKYIHDPDADEDDDDGEGKTTDLSTHQNRSRRG